MLGQVPENSPTLCDGWDAFDLAVHVWTLNHDVLAWGGLLLPALAPLTASRMTRIRQRFTFPGLVDTLRHGPAALKCAVGDARDEYRHALGEYFIHTEDVRRPAGLLPAEISPELAEALWQRLRVAAAQLHPRARWEFRTPTGGEGRVGGGQATTIITGEPGELLMWVYGRHDAAHVTVVER